MPTTAQTIATPTTIFPVIINVKISASIPPPPTKPATATPPAVAAPTTVPASATGAAPTACSASTAPSAAPVDVTPRRASTARNFSNARSTRIRAASSLIRSAPPISANARRSTKRAKIASRSFSPNSSIAASSTGATRLQSASLGFPVAPSIS